MSVWRTIFSWEVIKPGQRIFVKPNAIPELEKGNSYAGHIKSILESTVVIYINGGHGEYSVPIQDWPLYFEVQPEYTNPFL